MSILITIFCIWGASALVRASKEAKRKRELEKQRREAAARSAELARMAAEWKQRQAEAKIEAARLAALEREQLRQAKEQEKLAKEQEKQAATLEKHEKRIAALENKVRKLERDIESQKALIGDYYAQLDWLLLQQSETTPGGKEFAKWQDKIVTKSNQLRRAENKLEDMKDARRTAQRELAA